MSSSFSGGGHPVTLTGTNIYIAHTFLEYFDVKSKIWVIFVFCFIFHKVATYLHWVISSPEPSDSQGELILYLSSHRPSVDRRRQQFQASDPLKPLGQSKPNFMWSLLWKGERKFISMVQVTLPR